VLLAAAAADGWGLEPRETSGFFLLASSPALLSLRVPPLALLMPAAVVALLTALLACLDTPDHQPCDGID
jgi:hypothetical protein